MVAMGLAYGTAMTRMISGAGTDHMHWVSDANALSWYGNYGYDSFADVWF